MQYSASRCSAAGFMVRVLKSTLSVSVTVRRTACSKRLPDLELLEIQSGHAPSSATGPLVLHRLITSGRGTPNETVFSAAAGGAPIVRRMYRYDEIDQALVDQRVAEFRDQTRRFLAGELSRRRVPPAAAAQRAVHPAACAHAAHRDSLWPAEHAPAAHARRTSRASTTAATATSPRGRTCSSTGRSSRTCRTSWPSWPRCRCTPSRPAATASATSPPITSPASRRTRSTIRGRTARSSASGRRCIRSSPTCRASSRSPSPARRQTAPPPKCTTSACT